MASPATSGSPPVKGTAGPWVLDRQIGAGAMGVVFRGVHKDTGRSAAVKVVGAADEALLVTLRREIDALSRLDCEAIPAVLEAGTQEAQAWYAMELCEGPTLDVYAREVRGRSATGSAEWLDAMLAPFAALASALSYVHGEGMVHGDLKPENVIVTPSRGVRLLDFGLASLHRLGRERGEVGEPGAGTVEYMAPEALRGELRDGRSDLYALGCSLYEALTGRTPFAADEARDVIAGHLSRVPAAPSAAVPGIPAKLDRLIASLLEKDPRKRIGYADVVERRVRSLMRSGARSRGGAQIAARSFLFRPGLAGRGAALRALKEHLGRLDRGRGAVVLIGGESGVGKTRLAIELGAIAQGRGAVVISAAAPDQTGQAPLAALVPWLRAVADRCAARGGEEARRLVSDHAGVLARYEPALAPLSGSVDAGPPPSPAALHEILLATMSAFVGDMPTVLIADDLQWIDELSLGFLERLARGARLRKMPLLLVGTFRDDEATRLERLVGSATHTLRPERLSLADASRMASDMMAMPRAPRALLEYLYAHTEGVPLFLAEYLRAAVAEGAVGRDAGGHWRVRETPRAGAVPPTLQEILLRRAEALPADGRDILALASAIGRTMDERILHEASDMKAGRAGAAIAVLLSTQHLQQIRPGVLGFSHDKLREVTYARLPEPDRVAAHRRVAEALRARGDAEPAALARHWERCGEHGLARGAYLEAATRARTAGAVRDAAELYEAFFRVAGVPDAESIRTRNHYAWMLYRAGDGKGAVVNAEIAVREAEALGDPGTEAGVLRSHAQIAWESGRRDTEPELLRSLDLTRAAGDTKGVINIINSLGLWATHDGRVERARERFEQALSLCREHSERRLEGIVELNYGHLERVVGNPGTAWERYQRSLDACGGEKTLRGLVLRALAEIEMDRGHLTRSIELYEEAVAMCRASGGRAMEAANLMGLGKVLRHIGEMRRARACFKECVPLLDDVSDQRVTLGIRLTEIDDLVEAGRLGSTTEARLRGVLSDTESLGEIEIVKLGLRTLAAFLMASSRFEEAIQAAERSLSLARDSMKNQRSAAFHEVMLARAMRGAGRLAEAEALCARAEPTLRAGGDPTAILYCAVEMGHQKRARGESAAIPLAEARALGRSMSLRRASPLQKVIDGLKRAELAPLRDLHHGEIPRPTARPSRASPPSRGGSPDGC